nr:MAG: fructose-2,6-bisphosphatase [Candidatus Nanosalinarum sp. J07AB56]
MSDTSLTMCRHGRTDYNDSGIVQGQLETEINETGEQQAEALAERLSTREFDAVYSSTMKRALQTARVVNERHGLEINQVDALREVERAEYGGEPFDDMVEDIRASDKEDYLWKPDGGESLEELKHRVLGFMEKVAQSQHDDVLAIAHGGPIKVLVPGVMGHTSKRSYQVRTDNCSVNELAHNGRYWEIELLNDTSHIG